MTEEKKQEKKKVPKPDYEQWKFAPVSYKFLKEGRTDLAQEALYKGASNDLKFYMENSRVYNSTPEAIQDASMIFTRKYQMSRQETGISDFNNMYSFQLSKYENSVKEKLEKLSNQFSDSTFKDIDEYNKARMEMHKYEKLSDEEKESFSKEKVSSWEKTIDKYKDVGEVMNNFEDAKISGLANLVLQESLRKNNSEIANKLFKEEKKDSKN